MPWPLAQQSLTHCRPQCHPQWVTKGDGQRGWERACAFVCAIFHAWHACFLPPVAPPHLLGPAQMSPQGQNDSPSVMLGWLSNLLEQKRHIPGQLLTSGCPATLQRHRRGHIQLQLHQPVAQCLMQVTALKTQHKRMRETPKEGPKQAGRSCEMGSTSMEVSKSQKSHEFSFLCP